MKLKIPSLPISFSKEEVKKTITDLIEGQGWKKEEILFTELKFNLVPFFTFRYDVFFESKSEEGEKIVSETQTGFSTLDAVTGELNETFSSIIEQTSVTVEEISDELEFEEVTPTLSVKEAKRIAQIKMAEKLGTGKENILISGVKLLLVPFWDVFVTLEEKIPLQFRVSGVNGEVFGKTQIPERGKEFSEITSEFFSELKDPRAWIKYSTGIVSDTAGFILKGYSPKKWLWTIILIIVLVLIALWIFEII